MHIFVTPRGCTGIESIVGLPYRVKVCVVSARFHNGMDGKFVFEWWGVWQNSQTCGVPAVLRSCREPMTLPPMDGAQSTSAASRSGSLRYNDPWRIARVIRCLG